MGVDIDRAGGPRTGDVSSRYHMLDAWRGLACLMVVVHHAGYALHREDIAGSWWRWAIWYAVRRMDLGVPIFFVISGYCIAASAEASVDRDDSPWTFLRRRIWRIYPPYWIALGAFALFLGALDLTGWAGLFHGRHGVELDAPWDLHRLQWLGNLTLTETWRPHFLGPDRNVYTGVAWSLCFEEQFYFLCFLILCLAPGRMAQVLAGVTALVSVGRIYAWWVDGLDALSGCFPLLWHQFVIGVAVYYRLVANYPAWINRLIELALLALLVSGLMTDGRETATAAAFGLALLVLKRWDTRSLRAAWLAPLRESGRRCYAIYLVHLPASVVGNQLLYDLGVTTFWGRTLTMIPLVSIVGVACGWYFHDAVESLQTRLPKIWRQFQERTELAQRRFRPVVQPKA